MAAENATVTEVASSIASVLLVDRRTGREGLTIFNDSTAALHVKFGSASALNSYTVKIAAGGFYEMPGESVFTGPIYGIWAAVNGEALVTELHG